MMRAVGFTRFGGPEVLGVVDVPEPALEPGKIRVRVHAATVNPTDTLLRAAAGQIDPAVKPPPWTPGQELAGIVESVGEGVSEWRAGDRVAAVTRPADPATRGAQAELAVVWSDSVVRVPPSVTLTAAATLPMNGLTARQAIDRLQVGRGGTLVVTGAAGAVGSYALQIALTEGIKVIAVAAAKDEQLVRSLGAQIFVASGPDLVPAIRRIAPAGVDGVVDAALLGPAISPAIRDGGAYAGVRGAQGVTSERGIRVEAISVGSYLREAAKLAALMDLVEAGKLTLRVAETFPPERAADAHRKLEARGVRGRLVIVFRAE